MNLIDFWEMTPKEFLLCIEAFEETEKQRAKELIVQAYYTEAFARMKKLPKLEKLLEDRKEKKVQTDEEMYKMVELLNARFGGVDTAKDS